ncbi:hypothetical protein [Halalkalibacter oceani]|uniref:hypothetical protein n=1 Tax=Halalkalibacter oceani TaxID=1653776 RepID=UPI003395E169
MNILMLILAVLFLLVNIKGYKKIFKPSDSIGREITNMIDECKTENEKSFVKLLMLLFTLSYSTILLIYYIAAGVIMTELIGMVLSSVLFGVNTVLSMIKIPQMIEGKYKYSIYSRVMHPAVTFYHIYFILFLLF